MASERPSDGFRAERLLEALRLARVRGDRTRRRRRWRAATPEHHHESELNAAAGEGAGRQNR